MARIAAARASATTEFACPAVSCLLSAALICTMAEIHDQFDTILILDFGSQVCLISFLADQAKAHLQYSHLITRRCRELNVYAELMPCTQKVKALSWKPKGKLCNTRLIVRL